MGDDTPTNPEPLRAWAGLEVKILLQPKLFMPYGCAAVLAHSVYLECDYRIVSCELWAHEFVPLWLC